MLDVSLAEFCCWISIGFYYATVVGLPRALRHRIARYVKSRDSFYRQVRESEIVQPPPRVAMALRGANPRGAIRFLADEGVKRTFLARIDSSAFKLKHKLTRPFFALLVLYLSWKELNPRRKAIREKAPIDQTKRPITPEWRIDRHRRKLRSLLNGGTCGYIAPETPLTLLGFAARPPGGGDLILGHHNYPTLRDRLPRFEHRRLSAAIDHELIHCMQDIAFQVFTWEWQKRTDRLERLRHGFLIDLLDLHAALLEDPPGVAAKCLVYFFPLIFMYSYPKMLLF